MINGHSPTLGGYTEGVDPGVADVLTVAADAGGSCTMARLMQTVGLPEYVAMVGIVAARRLGYLRRYDGTGHDRAPLFQVTDSGRRFVRPPFAFDAPAALAWLAGHGGADYAEGLGVDGDWASEQNLSDEVVRDIATVLPDLPADVFVKRGNWRLTAVPVSGDEGEEHAFLLLVTTPDGATVTEESPRELEPLFDWSTPSTGPERLVVAVARVVSIANTLAAIRVATGRDRL